MILLSQLSYFGR